MDMTTTERKLRDGTVSATESTVHYVEAGTGDPVILVHGYADFSTWRVWEANVADLSAERRVIALDLPGYGESEFRGRDKPVDFLDWFETYAQILYDVIYGLDLGPAALCGLSAGGCASLLATTKWPNDVSKLILVDSAGSQAADRWAAIQQPTLIVWQREDKLISVGQGQILREAIPNSRIEILEGNGAGIEPHQWHWPQALNPERFNQLALEFLRDV